MGIHYVKLPQCPEPVGNNITCHFENDHRLAKTPSRQTHEEMVDKLVEHSDLSKSQYDMLGYIFNELRNSWDHVYGLCDEETRGKNKATTKQDGLSLRDQ